MDRIEGKNPVFEALKAGREIEKLLLLKSSNEQRLKQLESLARKQGIEIEFVPRQVLDKMSQSHAHQGVIAKAEPLSYLSLNQLLAEIGDEKEALIVILDEIQDPHNFGSILRTAEAAGCDGVIIPERRAVGFTPVVAKTSAGAVEHLPVAMVKNIARTIKQLKEEKFWLAGADAEAKQTAYQGDLTGRIGLVIGNEGRGLRRLVKERCDFLVKLPLAGQVESLNASVAAGILIYESLRQKKGE